MNEPVKIQLPAYMDECPAYWRAFIYSIKQGHNDGVPLEEINRHLAEFEGTYEGRTLTFESKMHHFLFILKYGLIDE